MTEPLHCPYPGLRAFREDEADLFFGRSHGIHDALQKLEQHGFIAIVGPSGAGKTSFVTAGLISALRCLPPGSKEGTWSHVLFRPDSNLIHSFAHALWEAIPSARMSHPTGVEAVAGELHRGPLALNAILAQHHQVQGKLTLLCIDQFEDLFRLAAFINQDEADLFVHMLLRVFSDSTRSGAVVITLRSDFIGDCRRFFGLPEALNASLYLIPRLGRSDTTEAVNGPVQLAGATIAPELSNLIINDAGSEIDHLPLLQHALRRTWQQANARGGAPVAMSLSDYQTIGGIANALSRHAEEALLSLDSAQQRIAETLFRLLTHTTETSLVVRRPIQIRELVQIVGTDVESVLPTVDAFASEDCGFLVADLTNTAAIESQIVDISHEAIIRGWPRLTDWVNREANSARQYIRVLNAARHWKQGEGDLYQGQTLDEAAHWLSLETPNAAWAARYSPVDDFGIVQDFISASLAADGATTQSKGEKIFLSYRRDDSSHAADRLYGHLVERFGQGNIFYDVDTIPFGADFQQFITERLVECGVFIAVIGDHWLDARFREGDNKGGRRLDDASDLVRMEIQAALRIRVPIIPVLVGHGGMPGQHELPAAIADLSGKNAARLAPGRDFHSHLGELVREIEGYIRPTKSPRPLFSRIRAAFGLSQSRKRSITE